MTRSRERGLSRLQSLRLESFAVAEEMSEHRARFKALKDPSATVRAVSSFNLFQTPVDVAERMADLLPGGVMLEPSAGLGRLFQAYRRLHDSPATLVDNSRHCCDELERIADDGAEVICQDFLAMEAAPRFDSILMNPPFKMGRDIKHTQHAHNMLKPGGLLVGLCYAGARQNAKLRPLVDHWEVLPSGTFKSEGTGAEVALIVWEARP